MDIHLVSQLGNVLVNILGCLGSTYWAPIGPANLLLNLQVSHLGSLLVNQVDSLLVNLLVNQVDIHLVSQLGSLWISHLGSHRVNQVVGLSYVWSCVQSLPTLSTTCPLTVDSLLLMQNRTTASWRM